tara:strand:+ start:81 stop:1613 length:1533 start_codon:yes stop_codon:yes gene_type:complete
MAALPSGETFNEQMWVVFFALSRKDPSLSKISEDTWIELYSQKDRSKFTKFLKDNNIDYITKDMALDNRFNTADLKAARAKFLSKKNGGLDWHNALKSQAVSFRKHQKGKIASSPTFKVTRQGEFYNLCNLTPFLKSVKSFFGAKFQDDRWNPSDVWFFKDAAVKEIRDFITHSSVMDSGFMSALPRSKQKAVAIYDVKQMNELLLVLYEKNILIPISLKKATSSGPGGSVYTSRVGINNGRKDKDNQPKDPEVTKKTYPIVESGDGYVVGGKRQTGGRNLKYDLKTQVATIDANGKQVIKTEYDYVNPGTTNNIVVASSGEFGAAQGGSMSLTEAENVIYTARGMNALRKMRRDAVPNNANVITNVYDGDIERSKKYMENLSKDLEPQKTKGELKLSNNEQSLLKNKRKALEYAKDAQNKLEIAVALKESGKEDEIIIDLWKSCTSKGIVRRKDFERILGRAAREEKYRAKKVGKNLTDEQAEKIAFDKLSVKVSPSVKIPASVHLKLY